MSDQAIGGGDGSSGIVMTPDVVSTIQPGRIEHQVVAAIRLAIAVTDSSRRMRRGNAFDGPRNVACSNPGCGIVE